MSGKKKVLFSLDEAISSMQLQIKKPLKQRWRGYSSRLQLKELTKSLHVKPRTDADPFDCFNTKFSSSTSNIDILASSMRYLQHNLKLCQDVKKMSKKLEK